MLGLGLGLGLGARGLGARARTRVRVTGYGLRVMGRVRFMDRVRARVGTKAWVGRVSGSWKQSKLGCC